MSYFIQPPVEIVERPKEVLVQTVIRHSPVRLASSYANPYYSAPVRVYNELRPTPRCVVTRIVGGSQRAAREVRYVQNPSRLAYLESGELVEIIDPGYPVETIEYVQPTRYVCNKAVGTEQEQARARVQDTMAGTGSLYLSK